MTTLASGKPQVAALELHASWNSALTLNAASWCMQGMAAPLVAQKRDGRHGIITHADADQKPKVVTSCPPRLIWLPRQLSMLQCRGGNGCQG